jgi:hypothetical protein
MVKTRFPQSQEEEEYAMTGWKIAEQQAEGKLNQDIRWIKYTDYLRMLEEITRLRKALEEPNESNRL